jgi:hypothetical protein
MFLQKSIPDDKKWNTNNKFGEIQKMTGFGRFCLDALSQRASPIAEMRQQLFCVAAGKVRRGGRGGQAGVIRRVRC